MAKTKAKKTSKAAATKPRKKRQRYTAAKQAEVLAAAQKENLTANQIQQRFGVTPVTYYSWRKKAKLPPMPRGRRPGTSSTTSGVAVPAPKVSAASERGLRAQVRRHVEVIVREEIRRALEGLR